jgi:hypothetical protein
MAVAGPAMDKEQRARTSVRARCRLRSGIG